MISSDPKAFILNMACPLIQAYTLELPSMIKQDLANTIIFLTPSEEIQLSIRVSLLKMLT